MKDPVQAAELAIAALGRASMAEAERVSRNAIRKWPRHPSVLLAYGAVMNAGGVYREAIRAFEALVRLEPKVSSHWMNFATALRAAGELERALDAYREAGRRGERSADFHYNLALLHSQCGKLSEARAELEIAARLAPADVEIRFYLAQAYFASVDQDATLAALSDWRRWQGWTADALAGVASLLLQMGEQDDAMEIVQRLDRLPDRSPETELQIIGMLERTNKLAMASARLNALNIDPQPGTLLRRRWEAIRAQIATRDEDWSEAERLYRSALSSATDAADQQHFLFPLAKVLDSKGDHSAAIAVADEAHVAQVTALDVSDFSGPSEAERPIMAITAHGCAAADVQAWTEPAPPLLEDSPVFIVAFPRSGTTLLEQMLDAHPRVKSMDEQPFLQKATLCFSDYGADYPSRLGALGPDELSAIRRKYWELTATEVRLEPGQRLLDKNPLNMLRLATICRLFPNARILLAIRHPCDVIISNYFQHYRAPEFVRLCRDLPTLALAYRKAFDFWYEQAAVLRPQVMEVRYETFVSDFGTQARKIADFLGLEWSDAMLSPGAHAAAKGFISTPSYSQVVKPISTKAIDRWRRYQAQLAPIMERISPYLQRWGYDQ